MQALGLAVLVFQHLKNESFPSGFHSFWWEICHSVFPIYVNKGSFLLCWFQHLSLIFRSVTLRCFGIDLYRFILFNVHWTSLICRFLSFAKFEGFSATISLSNFSALLLSSSPSNPAIQGLNLFLNSPAPWGYVNYFFNLFCFYCWVFLLFCQFTESFLCSHLLLNSLCYFISYIFQF